MKFTTGGLWIATLVIVTVGCRSAHTAAAAAIASGFVSPLLGTLTVPDPPEPGLPGFPGGPEGPLGPLGPAGPAGPESPLPQAESVAARIAATMPATQSGVRLLSIVVLPTSSLTVRRRHLGDAAWIEAVWAVLRAHHLIQIRDVGNRRVFPTAPVRGEDYLRPAAAAIQWDLGPLAQRLAALPVSAPRVMQLSRYGFAGSAAFAGSFGSSGSLCATPVWQSMHVALPLRNFLCWPRASSDCFWLSHAFGSWQVRQFSELFARISSHTSLARRQRSWSNFSRVEIVPRISPQASRIPAFAL